MSGSGAEFSICVPTHNRASLLPKFFSELSKQRHEMFELVIVNDGSTDATSSVITSLADKADFVVRHIDQPHGGRARALNRALDEATGKFIVILGDDDCLVAGALERMRNAWESIPLDQRSRFCGVCGLSADTAGRVLGDRFPADTIDSDFFQMRIVAGVRGDKREAVLRSAIGDYRFKVFDSETRVPTSSLWLHLAKSFRTRFVNEIWCEMQYLAGGMTKSLRRIRAASSRSTAAHYREILDNFPAMPSRLKVRYIANLVRYALHSRSSLHDTLRGLPFAEAALGAPIGAIAAGTDNALLFLRRFTLSNNVR